LHAAKLWSTNQPWRCWLSFWYNSLDGVWLSVFKSTVTDAWLSFWYNSLDIVWLWLVICATL
jgi:hypothetical protein